MDVKLQLTNFMAHNCVSWLASHLILIGSFTYV